MLYTRPALDEYGFHSDVDDDDEVQLDHVAASDRQIVDLTGQMTNQPKNRSFYESQDSIEEISDNEVPYYYGLSSYARPDTDLSLG
jgi:hypothetical protein